MWCVKKTKTLESDVKETKTLECGVSRKQKILRVVFQNNGKS